MPVLKNLRHERFAQLLAEGKTAEEAYEAAGFMPNPGNARRLKLNEAVRKRVEALLTERAHVHARAVERAVERTEMSLTRLIEMAVDAYDKAMTERGGASAAVAAVKELGVLTGERVERSERRNINDASQLSEHELDAAIAAALAREEAAAGGAGKPH